MRTNVFVFAAIAAVMIPSAIFAQQPRPQLPQADYKFTVIKENPITSIKNQASSSTCWCFSTIAFLESEIIRIKGIKDAADYPDLSEMFVVSQSYKEARMAMDVGSIFYAEKNVTAYTNLGIGRLIYQLPVSLCEMFLGEIFDGGILDDLDEESRSTIKMFFENNLNVSETSRQLFVHRNTLVYRIEKLQKTTGLDLRSFDDAVTFKIALMVESYLKHMSEIT